MRLNIYANPTEKSFSDSLSKIVKMRELLILPIEEKRYAKTMFALLSLVILCRYFSLLMPSEK
jgi:hypothetical protein